MQPKIVSDSPKASFSPGFLSQTKRLFEAFLESHPAENLSRLEKQKLLDFKVDVDLDTSRPSPASMQAAWNNLAAKYDAIPTLDQRLKVFEKLFLSLAFRGDEDLLSVGCGSGLCEVFIAKHLNQKGKTHCLDFSRPFLERALRLAQKEGAAHLMDFLEAPAGRIPLPGHSVDKILCLHSLEYAPDWEQALREFRRVLRPSDLARLAVFCNDFPATSFSLHALLEEAKRAGFALLESAAVKVRNFRGGQGEIAFLLFKPAGP